MSLRRTKRSSSGQLTRRSRSDFSLTKDVVKTVESGFEDIDTETAASSLAADLRSIGNKYDKLVLKMFNQRSNLRGDLMLLKKDAKLLRNEMKCLIVKHDNATAFKKGYGPENHEKERVLKAEIVTKEMGHLELTLADLMSKYYYLLEQTKTLKEINSLWHIRSVLKSDFVQLKSSTQIGTNVENMKVQDSIVKKGLREIRNENAHLTQKLRWLTKLSQEFRSELQELRSAKSALLSGRSCLEKEYSHLNNVDPIQESIPQALDMSSISKYVRDAEVRIIDSLHERIEALDKLSDAFKAVMVKAGFGGLESKNKTGHNMECRKEDVIHSAKNQHQCVSVHQETPKSEPDNRPSDMDYDSDDGPEEVQVRYIRKECLKDLDLRCLPIEAKHANGEVKASGYSQSNQRLNGAQDFKDTSYNSIKTFSSGYGSSGSKDMSISSTYSSSFADQEMFVDSNESFQTAVTVWLSRDQSDMIEKASEETLTGDVNSNAEDEELCLCEQIEKQFEDIESDRQKSLKRKHQKSNHLINTDGHKNVMGKSGRFTKELTSILSKSAEDSTYQEDEEPQAQSSFDATDFDNRYDRFYMAKSFFQKQEDGDREEMGTTKPEAEMVKSQGDKAYCSDEIDKSSDYILGQGGCPAEEKAYPECQIVKSKKDAEVNEMKSTEMQSPLTEKTTQSTVPTGKVLLPEDRPVFYDPAATWNTSVNTDTRFMRSGSSLSRSNTLDRNVRRTGSFQQRVDKDKQTSSLRSTTPNAYKTLPRGFKARKMQEKEEQPSTATKAITPRKEQVDQHCSTLPRKMKIGTTKQPRPVSHIPTVGPDIPGDLKDSKHSNVEPKTNNRFSSLNRSLPRSTTQMAPRRLSRDSNLGQEDSKQRNATKNPKPISRIGSFRQGTAENKNESSTSRPLSRVSSNRQDNRGEITRPRSRTGSFKQSSSLSIYGTLPRTRKRLPDQKVGSITENGVSKANQENKFEQHGKENNSLTEALPIDSKTISKSRTPSDSYDRIEVAQMNSQPNTVLKEEKIIIGDNGRKHSQGTYDENRNKEENVDEEIAYNSVKRKSKVLSIKKKKSKGDNFVDNQTRNDTKQEGEKKSKKTVSEKAANFMHNALRLMSSDSKTSSKNITKNSQPAEIAVRRRPQSVSGYHENRKSFIPVPSLS